MVEVNQAEWEGIIWYSALLVLATLLYVLVFVKTGSSKKPNYGLIQEKEVFLLLRINIGLPSAMLIYALVLYLADLPAPRDNIFSAVILVRSTTLIGLVIFSCMFAITALIVYSELVLVYRTRQHFKPIMEREISSQRSQQSELQVCVAGVWNGFWAATIANAAGKDTHITCIDKLERPNNTQFLENMVADGVPEETVTYVKTSLTKMPFPSNSFDVVAAPYTYSLLSKEEDRISLVYELNRILKPGGSFLAQVSCFSIRSQQKLLAKQGFENLQRKIHWVSFLPVALFYGTKSSSNTFVKEQEMPSVLSAAAVSINDDEAIITVSETFPLLQKAQVESFPTHLWLRSLLILLLFLLMAGFLIWLVVLWPYLDVPKAIEETRRITCGFALPFVNGFIVILMQTAVGMREHVEEESSRTGGEIPAIQVVTYFLKYTFGALGINCLMLSVFWGPAMLTDWAMVYYGVNSTISTVATSLVIVPIIFLVYTVSKYVKKDKK